MRVNPSTVRSRKWRENMAANRLASNDANMALLQSGNDTPGVESELEILAIPEQNATVVSLPANNFSNASVTSQSALPISCNNDEDATLFSATMLHWPRRLGKIGLASSERLQILQKAIYDIKKITSPRPGSKRIPIDRKSVV